MTARPDLAEIERLLEQAERDRSATVALAPRSLRVWVRPDTEDELRRYRNVIAYDRQNVPGEESLVSATLTIDQEPEQPKANRRKE